MGVEPTKDRLAAPPGFEVRTPHRGRFSSSFATIASRTDRPPEQIEAMLVDAAPIAAAQRHAMTIEHAKDRAGIPSFSFEQVAA